jgi:hypothetical protein
MNYLAKMMGIGIACNLDMDAISHQIGKWTDKKLPPGSKDQQRYLPEMMNAVQASVEYQLAHGTPSQCNEAKTFFKSDEFQERLKQ